MRASVKVRREFAASVRFDPSNTPATGKLRAQHRISRLGAVATILSAEGAAGYLRPLLGEALAAADVIIPAIVLLVLLAAIFAAVSKPATGCSVCCAGSPTGPSHPLQTGTPSDP